MSTPSAARRAWPDFVKEPAFYSLCLTAKAFGQRPSAMLDITDPYTAYCLDEAGAFLMAREPPDYKKLARKKHLKPVNRDPDALKMLKMLGAKVNV